MSEYYGTRNYNVHDRYMSFLTLKGEAREVIIVPELANAGWRDTTLKMASLVPLYSIQSNNIQSQLFRMPGWLRAVNVSTKVTRNRLIA